MTETESFELLAVIEGLPGVSFISPQTLAEAIRNSAKSVDHGRRSLRWLYEHHPANVEVNVAHIRDACDRTSTIIGNGGGGCSECWKGWRFVEIEQPDGVFKGQRYSATVRCRCQASAGPATAAGTAGTANGDNASPTS